MIQFLQILFVLAAAIAFFYVLGLPHRDRKANYTTEKLKKTPNERTLTQKQREIDRNILRYKKDWIEGRHSGLLRCHDNLIELGINIRVEDIKYGDLLNCFEWQYKRFKIFFRDKFSCVDCGEISYSLHVHHKFYLVNRLPWEIEDEALVSLCRNCHTKRHQNEKIKVYGNHFNDSRVESKRYFFKICPRCNGTGYLPQFSHVEDGICFLCWGLNINRTIFSNRINYYLQNPLLYNLKSYYEESFDFFEAITLDYYKNNILDRLVTLEELKNRDNLPFGGSDPPNREEVLRNLDLPRTIEQDDNSLLEEDDGLPF